MGHYNSEMNDPTPDRYNYQRVNDLGFEVVYTQAYSSNIKRCPKCFLLVEGEFAEKHWEVAHQTPSRSEIVQRRREINQERIKYLRDLEPLTEREQQFYDRLMMEDSERHPDDPIRKPVADYIPCCREHEPGSFCILPKGH